MADSGVKLYMKLSESKFIFSKRMLNFFEALELETIGDLAGIPLEKLTCFKGFKKKCKLELIHFVEYENLGAFFKNFTTWKKKTK